MAFLGPTLESPGSSWLTKHKQETRSSLGYSRLGALTAVKGIMLITLTETEKTQFNCEFGTIYWA